VRALEAGYKWGKMPDFLLAGVRVNACPHARK